MHAPRTRVQRRPVHGVLLLDKPLGLSSNDALQKAKWLLRAEKAGHTGTLDPLATGVLPLCFGAATKFSQLQLDAPKTYEAVALLGATTTTGDAEGDVVERREVLPEQVTPERLAAVQQQFTGSIRQVPPMFSALKHEGKPLYEYARKGIVIERKARDITIYQIDITAFAPPAAQINVLCSKGTYIRTLSEDIAKHMGTLAHLTGLRRTATAGFDIAQSHTLEDLAALNETGRDALLLPCDVLVQHLPRLVLTAEQVKLLKFGQKPASTVLAADIPWRAYSEQGEFVGLVAYLPREGCLKAVRLMNTAAD